MGGPSAAIALQELLDSDVDTFIRVCTCGGMKLNVKGGNLIVATDAIRNEVKNKEYAPIELAAVSNHEIINALISSAKEANYTPHTGVVPCKDSFYGQHSPEKIPVRYELKVNGMHG